jgi:hypothetical protein
VDVKEADGRWTLFETDRVMTPQVSLAVGPAYPNPFNPSTTVAYTTPKAGVARVDVFDAAGRFVRTLVNGPVAAGRHTAIWDGMTTGGTTAASGVYFVRLEMGGAVQTHKVMLLK